MTTITTDAADETETNALRRTPPFARDDDTGSPAPNGDALSDNSATSAKTSRLNSSSDIPPGARPEKSIARAAHAQLIAALLWLPQAALIAFSIDAITGNGNLTHILLAALGVLLIGLLRTTIDGAAGRMAFRAARRILSEKREKAVRALAARSPIDGARPASGLAASVLGEQAEAIVPYLSRFQPTRKRATIVPLVIAACVLPFSWAAALILFVCAPLIPVFMALIGIRAKAASQAQLVEMGSMNAFLLDRLRGLATIRALDAVDLTANRLRADAESLKKRTMAVLRIAFLSSTVLELFSALGVAMVAVYVGFHLLGSLHFGAWNGRLTLAQGLFILLLAPSFFEPLRDLSAVWHDKASGQAAMEALDQLAENGLDLPGGDALASASTSDEAPATIKAPSVRIENLRFSHATRDDDVFNRFDLSVAPGEHVALFGPSGVGKSTLIALVAGLAPAEDGRIFVGDTELNSQTAEKLRAQMTWIGQRPHIFNGTMSDNVILGRDAVGVSDVERAFRFAALEEVARNHSSSIGEGGRSLSGGEGVRLAIARAAAHPQFGLILADEPTAHLDAQTATDISEGLMALAENRTMIVATHDPILADRMDRVIMIEDLMAEAAQ